MMVVTRLVLTNTIDARSGPTEANVRTTTDTWDLTVPNLATSADAVTDSLTVQGGRSLATVPRNTLPS